MIDPRDLDVADEVPPFEPPSDAELEQMARYYEQEGRARLRGAAPAVLVDELRALPDGLASRVRADLLLADVLRALRWPEGAIAAALGDRAGADRRER
ncbi:MAG TPA: hypothetical protein VG370_22545 [Chloroflexota bacterium]|nr:hypothetical protein [Chloroflexota bacterium]